VSLLRALFACGLYQLLREKDLHAKELFFFSFSQAARELYAAKKESSQAKRPKIMVLSAEKKSSSKRRWRFDRVWKIAFIRSQGTELHQNCYPIRKLQKLFALLIYGQFLWDATTESTKCS
jgi:hypothetical protein